MKVSIISLLLLSLASTAFVGNSGNDLSNISSVYFLDSLLGSCSNAAQRIEHYVVITNNPKLINNGDMIHSN